MPIDPSIPLQATGGPAPLNPVQTLAGIGQLRQQQQQQEAGSLEIEQRQQQIAAVKRAEVEDARLRALFAKGVPSAGDLYSTVGPVRGNEILKGLAAFRGEQLKTSKEIRDTVGSMAGGILALPPTMQEDAYKLARESLLTRGAQPEDIPEQFPGADGLKQIQVWAMSAKDQVDAAAPKLQNVPPGATVIDEKHPEAGPVFTAPPKAPDVGTFEDYLVTYARDVARKPVAALTASDKEKARQQWTEAARDQTPVTRYQQKEVLNDAGKPVMGNYDAVTGRTTDVATGQVIKNPKPVPSAMEMMDSRKFQKAAPVLKAVSELSEKINTASGLLAKMSGGVAKVAAKANYDDDVAEYQSLVSGFTPLVARALGHTGVLTQQDVDSVRELFPKPGDSKTLRDRKVARVMSIVSELQETEGVPTAPAPPAGAAKTNPFR